jgi:UDP-N-acetylmuramoyl-tripeptide--D-alanyl-D-alanine ligase
MLAALETLKHFQTRGRRIAVLGDMLELGADAAEAHRRIGRAVAASGTDFLIAVGTHAAGTAEGARASGMNRDQAAVCREPSEAAPILNRVSGNGDVILIKGSRGMRMERILEHLLAKR